MTARKFDFGRYKLRNPKSMKNIKNIVKIDCSNLIFKLFIVDSVRSLTKIILIFRFWWWFLPCQFTVCDSIAKIYNQPKTAPNSKSPPC